MRFFLLASITVVTLGLAWPCAVHGDPQDPKVEGVAGKKDGGGKDAPPSGPAPTRQNLEKCTFRFPDGKKLQGTYSGDVKDNQANGSSGSFTTSSAEHGTLKISCHWKDGSPNIQPGDTVLIEGEGPPPGKVSWTLECTDLRSLDSEGRYSYGPRHGEYAILKDAWESQGSKGYPPSTRTVSKIDSSSQVPLTVNATLDGITVDIAQGGKPLKSLEVSRDHPKAVDLSPGVYAVTAAKPGFQSKAVNVTVGKSGETIEFSLSPMPFKLHLTVDGPPDGATIQVMRGNTKLDELPPRVAKTVEIPVTKEGEQITLTFVRAGFQASIVVTLVPGGKGEKSVKMEPVGGQEPGIDDTAVAALLRSIQDCRVQTYLETPETLSSAVTDWKQLRKKLMAFDASVRLRTVPSVLKATDDYLYSVASTGLDSYVSQVDNGGNRDGRYLTMARDASCVMALLANSASTATVVQGWRQRAEKQSLSRGWPLIAALGGDNSIGVIRPVRAVSLSADRHRGMPERIQAPLGSDGDRPLFLHMSLSPRGKAPLRDEQGTVHETTFDSPFYIAEFEITAGNLRMYEAMYENDAHRKLLDPASKYLLPLSVKTIERDIRGHADKIVTRATPDVAFSFCNWLSLKFGYGPCYVVQQGKTGKEWKVLRDAQGFRLPTADEWQYAARYGFDFEINGQRPNWTERGRKMARTTLSTDPLIPQRHGDPRRMIAAEQPEAAERMYPLGYFDLCGNVWELCDSSPQTALANGDRIRPAGVVLAGGCVESLVSEEFMPWVYRQLSEVIDQPTGFRPLLPAGLMGSWEEFAGH